MKVGSKSVLFGAHCFFIHPWFVALAWWKLYKFRKVKDPYLGEVSLKDPRLWIVFFLHDIGYIGKIKMDDPQGESHPYKGAKIVSKLFDREEEKEYFWEPYLWHTNGTPFGYGSTYLGPWGKFSLFHSRFLAAGRDSLYSTLCVADKLAIALEPWWFYLPRVILSGEIKEYMKDGEDGAEGKGKYAGEPHAKKYINRRDWHRRMTEMTRNWAYEHRDGKQDEVTLKATS